jgi:hypothetical protein
MRSMVELLSRRMAAVSRIVRRICGVVMPRPCAASFGAASADEIRVDAMAAG